MSADLGPPLRVERHGAVALITIDRPATRNALSGDDMFTAFEQVLGALDADLTVGAAVLTGAGSAFCAGGNLAEMRERRGMFAGSAEQIAANYRSGIQRIPLAFERCAVPIVAAVNGPAIGAGNDLACMCDLRIASRDARFAESFVKIGIVPGDGGCWWLPRVVGPAHAAELALTGETIDAERALAIGLVSRLSAPEALLPDALALARRIAANPPQVLRCTKRLLQQGRTCTLEFALESAAQLQGRAHHTPEHHAALAAFFEAKRERG